MSQRWKILIADDEPTITDTYAATFEKAGIESEKAYDGKECVEKASLSPFDLILLDIRMPELDGYEVIKKLKALPHLKHTPIVFLTGLGGTSVAIETGYSLGAAEYWKKPMATEELAARVKSLLRASEAERKLREMQESFTGMIVHDLRGPLSAIVGFAEMIGEEEAKVGPEIAEMAAEIRNSGRMMLNIINDFHEITRFDSGEVRLARRPMQLVDVVNRGLEIHKAIWDEKSIAVTVECGDLPPLMLDCERMVKVVDQILGNAFRLTPPQGSIHIVATSQEQTVTLEIKDSGPGLPEKDLPLLFDKVRIATPGGKRRGSRSGLGLPICRAIVEAHGGAISAESATGSGTTIRITLPKR